MRHTVETQKRSWHLWLALAVVLALGWCGGKTEFGTSNYQQEQAQ